MVSSLGTHVISPFFCIVIILLDSKVANSHSAIFPFSRSRQASLRWIIWLHQNIYCLGSFHHVGAYCAERPPLDARLRYSVFTHNHIYHAFLRICAIHHNIIQHYLVLLSCTPCSPFLSTPYGRKFIGSLCSFPSFVFRAHHSSHSVHPSLGLCTHPSLGLRAQIFETLCSPIFEHLSSCNLQSLPPLMLTITPHHCQWRIMISYTEQVTTLWQCGT